MDMTDCYCHLWKTDTLMIKLLRQYVRIKILFILWHQTLKNLIHKWIDYQFCINELLVNFIRKKIVLLENYVE